ncbi:MAG TPA: hypothetical protein VNC39_14355 [Acidocella sp.]|uniref:hypothetical protein n=1 Tax=Acidocella sp. TaxID=50710 RepID=UPI002C4D757E|nr:hypothetical protein [Acidocella sp.]HVE23149.1 hypothetical protein [Acidocella sp.]
MPHPAADAIDASQKLTIPSKSCDTAARSCAGGLKTVIGTPPKPFRNHAQTGGLSHCREKTFIF